MAIYCCDFALLERRLGLNVCVRFDKAEGEEKNAQSQRPVPARPTVCHVE